MAVLQNQQPKKLNNKGMSLVEMLVALALLAIVAVTISAFLQSSNNQYKYNQKEVDLQLEAQTVFTQIKDLLIDASLGVSYEVDPSGEWKDLYIYNDSTYYRIGFVKADRSVYIREYASTADPESPFDTAQADLMSAYVTDFTVDLSQVESRHIVNYDMKLQLSERDVQTYVANHQIHLRNSLLAAMNKDDLYDGVPEKRSEVIPSSISVPANLYVWPGTTHSIKATVRSASGGLPSQSVVWVYENDGTDGGPVFEDKRTDKINTNVSQNVLSVSSTETGTGENAVNANEKYTFLLYAKTSFQKPDGSIEVLYSEQPVRVHIMKVTGLLLEDSIGEGAVKEVVRGDTIGLKASITGYNLDQISIFNQGGIVFRAFTTGTTNKTPYATLEMPVTTSQGRDQTAKLLIHPAFANAASIDVSAYMSINGTTYETNVITYRIGDIADSVDVMKLELLPSETNQMASDWLRGETKTVNIKEIPDMFVYHIGSKTYLKSDYEIVFQYLFENSVTNEGASDLSYVTTELNYVTVLGYQSQMLRAEGHKMTLETQTPFSRYDRVTVTAFLVSKGESLANAAGKSNSQTFTIPKVKLVYKKYIYESEWSDSLYTYLTPNAREFSCYTKVASGFDKGMAPALVAERFVLRNHDNDGEMDSQTYSVQTHRTGMSDLSNSVVFQLAGNQNDFSTGLDLYLSYEETDQTQKLHIQYHDSNMSGIDSCDQNGMIYAKNGGSGKSPYNYLGSPDELGATTDQQVIYYLNGVSRFVIRYQQGGYYQCTKQLYTQSTWMDAYNSPDCKELIQFRYIGNQWVK